MASANPLKLLESRIASVEDRKKQLSDQLAALEKERLALLKEEQELAIASRVIGRLTNPEKADESAISDADSNSHPNQVSSALPRKGPPRPAGIPTTRIMINTLLAEAEKRGVDGLTGRDIVLGIAARWWPGAGWNDVLPDAARLVRSGDLKRNGDLYVRGLRSLEMVLS